MSRSNSFRRLFVLGVACLLPLLPAAPKADEGGGISVAQVMSLLEQAGSDSTSRQMLTVYLTGIGETTGALLQQAREAGVRFGNCQNSMNLSPALVGAALTSAAPDRGKWQRTAATPIILADMLRRAQC